MRGRTCGMMRFMSALLLAAATDGRLGMAPAAEGALPCGA